MTEREIEFMIKEDSEVVIELYDTKHTTMFVLLASAVPERRDYTNQWYTFQRDTLSSIEFK